MANVNARRVEEILTSGITAGHYVAGSNITITENQDGTETIAASGGGGGGFTPTETQLAAMNSGITEAKVTGYDALPDDEDVKDIVSDHFVAGTNITITDNVDGTQTIASTASGGTTDYSDLTNKPSINNVTLSGNKTTSDLGIAEVPTITSSDGGKYLRANYYNATNTSDYSWANISSTDVINVLSGAQQTAINSGITSNKVSGYDTIVGQMETFYPKLLDVGENVGEITAEDLDNLSFGVYEYLGMFTGSTLPTEIANKTGVVRGYFTQETGAWNVKFQMVETTDGIFGVRTYNGSTWSNWTFNVPGGGSTAPTAYSNPTNNTWTSAGVNYSISGRIGGYVVSNNICTVNIRFNLTATNGNISGMLNQILFTGLPKPKSGLAVVLTMNQCANSSTYAFREYSSAASLTAAGEIRAPSSHPSSWTGMNYLVISGSYLVDTSS